MLTLRYARQIMSWLSPLFYSTATPSAVDLRTQSFFHSFPFQPASSFYPSISPQSNSEEALQSKDILLPFKDWFMTRKNPLFDRIYEILGTEEGFTSFEALRCLNLNLNERLVLDVLKYGKSHKDVFSCVRFFDWAGRQREFNHTDATFHAMFKIFYNAKLSSLIHDFLENFSKEGYTLHPVRFYDTLVIGYSVAGKPDSALQAFGKMRFQGNDLNSFAYHVLLNSLVEEGYFDVVPIVEGQIRIRGFDNKITHSIMMKNFCKKKDLNGAEKYLRSLMRETHGVGNMKVGFSGALVGILVDALCKAKQFEKVGALMDEMKKAGVDSMNYAYDVWARNLIQAGKMGCALEFYKSKMKTDGYTPGIHTYNSLVCRLLSENRLVEVFDLLIEMKELKILPDEVTMNATLCFFCKAGMMDAALKLYESRLEFGLSVNSRAYDCLIKTLFFDACIDDAFRLLKSAIEHGYFPGKKTFSIIANALCRERKLDEMKELILAALDRDFKPSYLTYEKFIIALCRSNRVQDGYKLLGELNKNNTDTTRSTYFTLISSFYRAGRGDIAASLLIEMQEKGHKPTRQLIRAVVCGLCSMDEEEGERQIFRLLELQLTLFKPSCDIYNFFIDGAGHAKKPHVARRVYQMIMEAGILPDSQSNMLLLQSFLMSGRFSDALLFFHNMSKRQIIDRRFWHIMIVGLCKGYKPELAMDMFWEMTKHRIPSIQCYEELLKLMCTCENYTMVFTIIDHMALVGRPVSTFIGNMLLLHSFYSPKLYYVCKSNNFNNLTPHRIALGELLDAFSDSIQGEEDVEELEVLIQRCFPLNLYTYNLLLRKIVATDINHAREYFNGLHKKGYEANSWSYDILIHGLLKHGRSAEAGVLAEELFSKGFDISEATRRLM